MRLLIPDPYTPQAFDLILALEDLCETIVVTVPDLGRRSRTDCFAAHSKRVSKTIRLEGVRPPEASELFFSAPDRASPEEERYLRRLLDICIQERINRVCPTCDNVALFLSRHTDKFRRIGVLVAVNEFGILKGFMDKLAVNSAAERAGIPCPRTVALDRGVQPDDSWFRSPQIVKPRLGSTGRGVRVLKTRADFETWSAARGGATAGYLLQDYIPGDTIVYCRVYMKRTGELLHASCVRCRRPELYIHQTRGLIVEDHPEPAFKEKLFSLFRERGYVGYGQAQFKVDARDGAAKLMEINVRISRGTWTETWEGFNAPLAHIRLFEDREITAPLKRGGPGTIFVWPVQDACIPGREIGRAPDSGEDASALLGALCWTFREIGMR